MEYLEPRMLLALPISGVVPCSVIKSNETLSILARGNEVWIGETKAGAFDVVCFELDGIEVTLERKFAGVRTINVVGGVEDDYIGFDLRGNTPVLISVTGNAGDDTLDVTLSKVDASIVVSANLGDGDDWMTLLVEGDIAAPFTIKTSMGAGDDYVEVTCYGQITGGLTTIKAALDAGNDVADIFVEAKRRAKAPVVQVNGGAGYDVLTIDDWLENRPQLLATQVEKWIVLEACDLDDMFSGVC